MAENNKLTSLGQLRKLAERALLDSQSRSPRYWSL